jgi:hypothetical protein
MSKLQWFLVIAATAVAFVLGAPQLKDSYVGYYFSGKCSEPDEARIAQCHPRRSWISNGHVPNPSVLN